MEKKNAKYLNLLLAGGMVLIFVGFILILCIAGTTPDFTSLIVPDLLFIAGFCNLYAFLIGKKSTFKLFFAMTLSLWGVFSALVSYQVIRFSSVKMIFPIYIFITVITLFISGRFRGKIFDIGYDFPALVLFCLGIIYTLFAFNVIKIPFKTLALITCPIVLIFAGIFLIVLFFQRKHLMEILPDKYSNEFTKEEDLDDCE